MALFGRPTEQDDARAETYRAWLVRRHPLAIASAVLGVFSLTHLGALWIDGIAAIVLGVIALRQLSRAEVTEPREGRGLAWLGILTAVVSIGIAMFLYGSG